MSEGRPNGRVAAAYALNLLEEKAEQLTANRKRISGPQLAELVHDARRRGVEYEAQWQAALGAEMAHRDVDGPR